MYSVHSGTDPIVYFPDTYHDVKYDTIMDTWFEQNGGEPEPGDRHKVMLQLAADMKYICSNNVDFLRAVLMRRQWVKDWVEKDGAGRELEDILTGATSKELWWGTPKRLKAVMATLGIKAETRTKPNSLSDEEELKAFQSFGERLGPLLAGPYEPVCQLVNWENRLAAIFASGTMFCSLMTRCWFEHYDGRETRLNPTSIIIGSPASGKSFAEKLDDAIMAAMRNADAPGRKAEKEYKRKRNERATSSKAQKADALEKPEVVIRYLPSKTSNAIFYQRAVNAKEVIDGDIYHLHLYMFDSELDSAVGAQKSDWAGKHDLELKAFHNETSGVDYANMDSVNDVIPIYWNQVITGTPVSLQKKFTMRNINDGFCTRVAICKMWPEKYRMMSRGNKTVNHEVECSLKEWGYRFDTMKGELKISKLVDHCYTLCDNYAHQAEETQDDVLDLLRKRAVFYAIWFTIPRIYGRQWERYKETGCVDINDEDLQFASIIYEAVIYWQDYFFGRMLEDSWQNAENEIQPRRRNSKAADDFQALPQDFTVDDIAKMFDIEKSSARQRIKRWKDGGYVKERGSGRPVVYEKCVSSIII